MNSEVAKVVEELYSCLPNDKNKFDHIMESLKEQFLSLPPNKNSNTQIFQSMSMSSPYQTQAQLTQNNPNNYNSNPINTPLNMNNNYCGNFMNSTDINEMHPPQKAIPDFKPINLESYVDQSKPLNEMYNREMNDINKFNDMNKFNNMMSNNTNMNEFYNMNLNGNLYESQMREDTHANFKYYYPDEYNNHFEQNNGNNMY